MSRFLAQGWGTREWVWWRSGFGDDLRLGRKRMPRENGCGDAIVVIKERRNKL
jgi:hypothetical protein